MGRSFEMLICLPVYSHQPKYPSPGRNSKLDDNFQHPKTATPKVVQLKDTTGVDIRDTNLYHKPKERAPHNARGSTARGPAASLRRDLPCSSNRVRGRSRRSCTATATAGAETNVEAAELWRKSGW